MISDSERSRAQVHVRSGTYKGIIKKVYLFKGDKTLPILQCIYKSNKIEYCLALLVHCKKKIYIYSQYTIFQCVGCSHSFSLSPQNRL